MTQIERVYMMQITSHYFTSGVMFNDTQRVTKAAPIVCYMLNWNINRVINYSKHKGWLVHMYELNKPSSM